MRPRQQTARHRRLALINTPQRSEGAWESCLARNAACGRGRFLLSGVGATRQGPRCQVALRRGCNRWCGFRQGDDWRLSIGITTGDMRDRKITTLSKEAEHPRANLRTQGPGWFRARRQASEAVSHRCATRVTRAAIEDDVSAGTLATVSKRQREASPIPRGHPSRTSSAAATHGGRHERHGNDSAPDREQIPMHSHNGNEQCPRSSGSSLESLVRVWPPRDRKYRGAYPELVGSAA